VSYLKPRSLPVFIVLFALAGCGSSSSTSKPSIPVKTSSSLSVPPSSKAQFIVAADKSCKQGNLAVAPLGKQLKALSQSTSANQSPQLVSLLIKIANTDQASLNNLQNIPEPPEDKTVLSRIFSAADNEILDIQNAATGLSHGDTKAFQDNIQAFQQAHALYDARAQSYGFHYCGTNR